MMDRITGTVEKVDPITAEIVHNYLESVAAQTIATMVRTSVSPIFNEGHDCSAADVLLRW